MTAPFYFYGRVGPGYRPLCHSHLLVRRHQILEGQHHDTLGQEVRIPFGKPDLSLIESNLVPVGAQN
jgi:hypothetical protein